jgi:hypothetical protein
MNKSRAVFAAGAVVLSAALTDILISDKVPRGG